MSVYNFIYIFIILREILSRIDLKNNRVLIQNLFFAAYRCCYCGFWNPAKKQRPSAPKLDFDNNSATPSSTSGITSSVDDEKINLVETETCTQSDTGIFLLRQHILFRL